MIQTSQSQTVFVLDISTLKIKLGRPTLSTTEEKSQNFGRSKSIILRLVLNLDTEGYTLSLKIRPNI